MTLVVGQYASFDPAADSGCVAFAANTSADTVEYLLVLQAAGGTPGATAPYSLRTETVAPLAAAPAPSAAAPPPARWSVAAAFDRFRHAAAVAAARPAARAATTARPALVTPPAAGSLRSFKVCADTQCKGFKTVVGRALSVGAHVAIYVDTLAPKNGLDSAAVATLQQLFDSRVYATDTLAFGRESDIDSNGVVIALLSGVVNAMVGAKQCDSSGFVAGFFYYPDLDPTLAAQYNHGEVFYAIVPDPLGTLSCVHTVAEVEQVLPVTFLHEFEHMINFGQHVLVHGGGPEDDWLDEALAKYAEELGGRTYLPGDQTTFYHYAIDDLFDAYQYLSAPEQHFLLTTTDQSAPDVGAGWLYLRYLVDQYGPGLSSRLVQTALTGTANVAARTGQPFDVTATRWALANWVSNLPAFGTPPELTYTSWSFRQTFYDLATAIDPRDFPRAWPFQPPTVTSGGSVNLSGTLKAGSAQYLLAVQPPSGAAISLHVNYAAAAIPAALVPRVSIIRIR